MKFTHDLFTLSIIPAVIFITAGFVFHTLYSEAKKNCSDKLNSTFISAIHQEKEKRMDRDHLFFVHGKSDASPDQIIIQQENETTVLEKPDSIKQLTFHEKQNHAEHTCLFLTNRLVNIHILDSIWHTELQKHQLSVQTAILYKDNINQNTRYSNEDFTFYTSAWRTPAITLGLRGEVTFQGFARLTLLSIVSKDSKRFVAVLIVWIVATGSFLLFMLYRKKRVHSPNPASETTGYPVKNQCLIMEHVLLDKDEYLVICDQTEIKLTRQMFQLFELLWNQPGHYASYQEINCLLFGKDDIEKVENRRAKAINRLRKELGSMSKLEIENVLFKGYKILLKPNTPEHLKQAK